MNRRGFGLIAMLLFCSFLGLCLLTSFYYYNQLIHPSSDYKLKNTNSSKNTHCMQNDYSGVSTVSVSLNEYYTLERQLQQAAKNYVQSHPIIGENQVVITMQTLQTQKIIDVLYDSNGYRCNGYVLYHPITQLYTPYIRCGTYATVDYVNRLE